MFVGNEAGTSAEFGNDIFILDWSPDGRYLAFAAVIENENIDLYVYDIEEDVIHRLTDNSRNVDFMKWSPNGKRIWLEASEPDGSSSKTFFYTLQADSLVIQHPKAILEDRWNINEGWVSSNEYFLVNSSEGCCGPNNLRYINVETGRETVLWSTYAIGYAIDPEQLSIAVSAAPEADLQGSYIVDWSGNRKKISDDLWAFEFRGGVNSRYIGFDTVHSLKTK